MRKGYSAREFEQRNYLLKKEAANKFLVVYPFWSYDLSPVDNVFRFLPAKQVVEDNAIEISPFRYSPEPRDYGPWLYDAYLANIGGKSGISFLLGNRLTHDEFELTRSPYVILYQAILRQLSARPNSHWAEYNLVRLSSRRPTTTRRVSWSDNEAETTPATMPLLSKPELAYFSFCLVAAHPQYPYKGQLYGLEPNQKLFILVMRRTIGEKLMDHLDTYIGGGYDIVGWHPGAFVHITRPSDPNIWGYDVSISKEYQTLSPSLLGKENLIIDKIDTWENVLYFPTVEEQIRYICLSPIPAEVIYFCLKNEFLSYLPDEIVTRAKEQMQYRRGMSMRVTENVAPTKPNPSTPSSSNISTNELPKNFTSTYVQQEIPTDISAVLHLGQTFTSNIVPPQQKDSNFLLTLSCRDIVRTISLPDKKDDIVLIACALFGLSLNWPETHSNVTVSGELVEQTTNTTEHYWFPIPLPLYHYKILQESGIPSGPYNWELVSIKECDTQKLEIIYTCSVTHYHRKVLYNIISRAVERVDYLRPEEFSVDSPVIPPKFEWAKGFLTCE